MPLFLIADGAGDDDKEGQLGDDNAPNVGIVSKTAFMSTPCFIEYLKFLRNQFYKDKKIH